MHDYSFEYMTSYNCKLQSYIAEWRLQMEMHSCNPVDGKNPLSKSSFTLEFFYSSSKNLHDHCLTLLFLETAHSFS